MIENLFNLLFPSLEPAIKTLINNFNLQELLPYTEIIYWLFLIIIIFISKYAYKKVVSLINNIRINKNNKELLEYYSEFEIFNTQKNYIPTFGQDVDPATFLEPIESNFNKIRKKNLVSYFLTEFKNKNRDKKFYLVLGDSGMGKTTFLLNLYIKYKLKIFPRKKMKIFLIPLSNSEYKKKIKEIRIDRGNSILLLDAFDEDVTSWADPEESLKELLNLVSGFSIIIITSRGHFFSSKINNLVHLNIFKNTLNKENYLLDKFFLSPLDNKDIVIYLVRKYSISIFKLLKARKIVLKCPNLMVRPMLLNNIDYLINEKANYTFTAEIYSMLILSWLRREKKFIDEISILSFSKDLAVNIYEERNKRKGLFINENNLDKLLKGSPINRNSVLFKTRSLLNRTGDKYKFSHKSIFEYFLAASTVDFVNLDHLHLNNFENPFYLEGLSDACGFYKDLFILKVAIPYINQYTNLSVNAESITSMKSMDLSGSKIKSLIFLKELFWLERLNLSRTLVRNLTPLYTLSNLKVLTLSTTYYDPTYLDHPEAIFELEELKAKLPNLKIRF